MSADALVFWVCACCMTFLLGYQTRIWAEEKQAARTPQALYGITKPEIRTAANVIGCPVTTERILEYRRICKGRDRNEAIGKQLIKGE